jgi:hypothetical protein
VLQIVDKNQVDFDGKYSYRNDKAEVEVYPNPTQGSFKINVSNAKQFYSIDYRCRRQTGL